MQILLIFKNVQLGAWLMACYLKGLNEQETSDLTKASMSFEVKRSCAPVTSLRQVCQEVMRSCAPVTSLRQVCQEVMRTSDLTKASMSFGVM